MKFKLTTAWFDNYSEVTEEYAAKLEKYGFKFARNNDNRLEVIKKTVELEVANLEQLMELIRQFGNVIIGEDAIMIYDDYVNQNDYVVEQE